MALKAKIPAVCGDFYYNLLAGKYVRAFQLQLFANNYDAKKLLTL